MSRLLLVLAWTMAGGSLAGAAPLMIVAAENFYGGVAQEVAGPGIHVTSILTNPNQDPHEFAASAGTARSIADAAVVIYSGIGYDPWAEKLLNGRGRPDRVVINVAELIGARAGDNPHIWYDPKTMPALADRLAEVLARFDAAEAAGFRQRAAAFRDSMNPLRDKIAAIKAMAGETAVTATEPVFGYMADALGLKMLNGDFQVKIMNDAEPSAAETAAFEQSLRTHAAAVLFYNSQVTDPTTARLREIAQAAGVPVVGVTETQPPDEKSYVGWMRKQLDGVQAALHARSG